MASERILLVDDSREMREYIVDYVLRPEGYEVVSAEDGLAGMALVRESAPDLILADMKMPGMSGIEMAQTIHQEQLGIPVILITAEGSEDLARQALRTGVADYLTKPFQEDDLLRSIRHALDAARARREVARIQAELTAAHRALVRQFKQLEMLTSVGRSVTTGLDLDQALTRVVEAAVALTGAEAGSLLLLDEESHVLTMRATKNVEDSLARAFRLRLADSLAGQVIRTGEGLLLNESAAREIAPAYAVYSLVYVPLRVRGSVIGVLGVDHRQAGHTFTREDQRLLHALSDYAAIAMENAHLFARTESERAELDTILHELEEGVIAVDTDDRLILINPTARTALGVDGTDVTGQNYGDVIWNPEVREMFNGKSRRAEVTLDDGRVFNAHLTPVAGVGRAIVLQEITHLKQLDHIKSEFVTAVSHDLRSPLTAILGYVELIGQTGPVNPQQAEFIRRIQYSVQSITSLITDLLDLGRIEAGFDAQKELTHLPVVLGYAVEALRPQAEAKRQQLNVSVPEELPAVLANAPRLRQMLANLIDNAIRYTPDGGRVDVKALTDDDLVVMTVSDSGIGIPLADQPYIFDKFYRASNTRHDYAGTGLGLSIVHSIVENHGGRIWLESKPGAGTTFTVVLPRHPQAREK